MQEGNLSPLLCAPLGTQIKTMLKSVTTILFSQLHRRHSDLGVPGVARESEERGQGLPRGVQNFDMGS